MAETKDSNPHLSHYYDLLKKREHLLYEKARNLLRLAYIEAELEGDAYGIGPNEDEYNRQILQAIDEASNLGCCLSHIGSKLHGQAEEFSFYN